jgi:hypothetical protein
MKKMKKIILTTLMLNNYIWADFSRDFTIGITSDSSTGLVWQDNLIPEKQNWENAINYCEELNLGGFNDWRLPNKRELFSIIDFGYARFVTPEFREKTSGNYWTSTGMKINKEIAFTISFKDASVTPYERKTSLNNIRCTR